MSNYHAIAAVTSTLRAILQDGTTSQPDLGDTTVTILPLDKARAGNTNNQLNLFLYMVVRNAAWVSADLPRQVHPGEVALPPLPLNLYYLVTAFGANDDVSQPSGHILLGRAMSVLHDHPVLGAQEIRSAASAMRPSDLDKQLERVRVTFHPLGIEELSKLWTGFAMQYRLSAAYEVAVTLIESNRGSTAALPVLTRGAKDQGVISRPDLASTFPLLDTLVVPDGQPAARPGATVELRGRNLDGQQLAIRFLHPLFAAPVERPALPGSTPGSVAVVVPADAANWPAGYYAISVVVQRPGETYRRETNTLVLAVAPSVTLAPAAAAGPAITYTASVVPDVRPEQRVSLMIGGAVFAPDAHPVRTGQLSFAADGLVPGTHVVRLRVDGVDSLFIDRTKTPPVFDATQQVVVT